MRGVDQREAARETIESVLAFDDPVDSAMAAVCRLIELQTPEVSAACLLFDDQAQSVSLKAAGQIPVACRAWLQDALTHSQSGIFQGLVQRATSVVVDDILADERCAELRPLVDEHELRAFIASPLISDGGSVLGALVYFFKTPGVPDTADQNTVEDTAGVIASAIGRIWHRYSPSEREQHYRSLFAHNPDAVYSLDRDGFVQNANAETARIAATPIDQLIGRHFEEFLDEGDRDRVFQSFSRARDGIPQRFEVSSVDANGGRYVLDITNLPIIVDDRVDGVYAIAKDITRRKADEARLRMLKRGVETSVNGTVIIDTTQPDLPIIYANQPFLRMTGFSDEEVLGRNARFLWGPDSDEHTLEKIRKGIAEKREIHVTLICYRKDGSQFWSELFVSPFSDEAGEMTHMVGVLNDVSERKIHEERLAYQASHEPLTGLPNRGVFEQRLAQAHDRAKRQGHLLAVLYVDLDDFKPVNDSLGHAFGDEVIKEAAGRLSTIVAGNDLLASVGGGDEFVILLEAGHEPDEIRSVAERILAALAKPYRIRGRELHLTGSIGIATNEVAVEAPAELIQHADMAMYLAKKRGHNTYNWYTGHITTEMDERVTLRRELHEAIETGAFELYYQPLIDAHNGSIKEFEALIRWNHPQRGLVSPATFIPLAERTGQIIAIGQWVVERACRDLVTLYQRHNVRYSAAVNVSPLQFHSHDFLATLERALIREKLPGSQLHVELTESVLMENAESALETLGALRKMGVEVSIDDFGTGYSSLSYLKQLPVNRVKIDRSFTRDITTDRRDAAIAQSVITLAHNLGLQVVAEGIEAAEQRTPLLDPACDLFQGFFYARPMPLDDLSAFLDQGAVAFGDTAE